MMQFAMGVAWLGVGIVGAAFVALAVLLVIWALVAALDKWVAARLRTDFILESYNMPGFYRRSNEMLRATTNAKVVAKIDRHLRDFATSASLQNWDDLPEWCKTALSEAHDAFEVLYPDG